MTGLPSPLAKLRRKAGTFRQMTGAERRAWVVIRAWALGRLLRLALVSPVYLIPGILLGMTGVRFLPVPNGWRGFGDLIELPAQFIRATDVGTIPRRRSVLLAPSRGVANPALIREWRGRFIVIDNCVLANILLPFAWIPFVGFGLWHWKKWEARGANGDVLRGGLAMLRVDAIYGAKHGSLKVIDLAQELTSAGRERLMRFGIAEDSWWVTLHVRERGYHQDDDNHHRNGDITTYLPALKAIADRGGWVIRVGDPSMHPLPPLDHVIDYIHTEAYCDWMDLYLAAHCRFMLGTSSGPCTLPVVYGKPMVCTNLLPVGPLPTTKNHLVIPKLHWLTREQRFMRTSEVLRSRVARAFYQDIFEKSDVEVVDNTPDEITEVTTEMIAILDGSVTYTGEDESHQHAFREQWMPEITSDLWGGRNRVGRDFLRKYAFVRE